MKLRTDPLEVIQTRMEYFFGLMQEEIALGDMGSREKIWEYSKIASQCAEALAPYRHLMEDNK